MADLKLVKWFRFGAMSAVLLALLTWLINLVTGQTVAKIQFALIKTDLQAKVGITGMELGERLISAITSKIGFAKPNIIVTAITLIVAGGLAVVLGRVVYYWVHEKWKVWTPKSQTGKIALLLFHSGLIAGILLGLWTGVLPVFGTAITLALNALVTALILVFILNTKAVSKVKVLSESKVAL